MALSCIKSAALRVAGGQRVLARPTSVRLTYFDLEGRAELPRLALKMTGTDFVDVRIKAADWPKFKARTPFGKVPILEVEFEDGDKKKLSQSWAIVRYIASAFDKTGTLLPRDAGEAASVEEMVGLVDDAANAWFPCLQVSRGLHKKFGHPTEMPDRDATVRYMYGVFMADAFPTYMPLFCDRLDDTGAFLCGPHPTIADIYLLALLRNLTSGATVHIPTNCLLPYPNLCAFMKRMYAIPEIRAWYKK